MRVEADRRGPAGRARLVQQGEGGLAQCGAWLSAGAFRDATCVLMLKGVQRQILVLDQPQVPEAEQIDALRWPVAEALDVPAESLRLDAARLPPLNDTGKGQVLVAATTLPLLQPLIDALAEAGIEVDEVDVADMAQRNAALLLGDTPGSAAQVVLGMADGELLMGLVAQGELCMARNLPLPSTALTDDALRDRIVLHVQRTVDLLERQITRFAIGGARVFAGDFPAATLEALRQVLTAGIEEIALSDVVAADAEVASRSTAATVRLAALAALRCRTAGGLGRTLADATAPGQPVRMPAGRSGVGA